MKVVLASSSGVSIPVLNSLKDSNDVELISVITNPDKATGRGQEMRENAVAMWCNEYDIAVDKPQNSEELLDCVTVRDPELLITVAFGHILKTEVLSKPKFGAINLHYSLLPAYRGAAPVQWAIINGEDVTGVTVFKLDAGMDTGPIYVQKKLTLDLTDSTATLIAKLNVLGVDSVMKSIELIKKGEIPSPQSDSGISYAPKFTKSDGEINWSDSAVSIFNRFRALSENPGVFTQYHGQKIRVNQLSTGDFDSYALKPGKFVVNESDLIIGTSHGCLSISKLTPEGRKIMSGSDFFNGLTNKQVDFFG